MSKGAMWRARLSSFSGVVAGASHWHVLISGSDREAQVEWRLDAETAAAWTSRDQGYQYRPGEMSKRFTSEQDAVEAATVAFRHLAGPRDLLVRGMGDPAEPMAGPDDLMAEAAALQERYDAAEAEGPKYGPPSARLKELWQEWSTWAETHFASTDTAAVRTSHLNPEPENVVVVERDPEGAWTIAAKQFHPDTEWDDEPVHGNLVDPDQ